MNRLARSLVPAALLAGCGAPPAPATDPVPAPQAEAPPAAPAAPAFPSVAPQPGPAPDVRIPQPETRRLANGLTVMYVRQPEVPVVNALLVTPGAGTAADPSDLPGLAAFTAGLIDEGAGGRSALQIADALDLLGAGLSTSAGWDAAQANLYVLRKNLPDALGIMADVVARPDFPANEVERQRGDRLTALQRGRDEPTVIAGNAFQTLVFGASHPYGRPATTTATRAMSRARLVSFHHSRYRPETSTLILVGDVDPASVHPVVERAFGSWRATGAAPAAAPSPRAPTVGSTTIYLVDKPGAAQSQIRIGHPGVARDNPDYFPLVVMNTLLGGSFTSRLNNNLREVHGYAYGAQSGFSMRRGAGPFTAQAGVVTAKTDSSLIEFFKELRRIREEPIPAADLDRAKRYVALGFPQGFETTSDVAAQLSTLVLYGMDPQYYNGYVDRVMAVTAEDVARVAKEYVRPDQAVVVVVGDRKTIEPGIRATGLAPVVVRDVSEFVK